MDKQPLKNEEVVERLRVTIQGVAEEGEVIEGALLVNFVVVAEWAARDGERWLSHIASPGSTVWNVKGMLNDVLDELRT